MHGNTHSLVALGVGLHRGFAGIASHQSRPIDLDNRLVADDSQSDEGTRNDSRNCSLSRAGIASENHMVCHRRDLESLLAAGLVDLDKIDNLADLGLDAFKPDQSIQFSEDVLDSLGRRR